MTEEYNFENIRALLIEGFTEDALRILCYDEPEFKVVYHTLPGSASKSQIVQELIEYADQQMKLGILLELAKKHNPARYEHHQPYHLTITIFSEDGQLITNEDALSPPLPEFEPGFLAELEAPGGVVKLRDKLYIQREADVRLKAEIIKWGTTTTIRAPGQTGKTSLLMRGIHHARQSGAKVVWLDFQSFGHDQLTSPDTFLRELARAIYHELRLDEKEVDKAWQGSLGAQTKLTFFMGDHVLPKFEGLIILAMDEVDRLLQTPFYSDFFALIRSWDQSRNFRDGWDKLNIVMATVTEPYLFITGKNQSPFNVGLKLYLNDFTETQIRALNRRHNSPLKENNLHRLMQLLSGQPYLTRKALYTLVTERLTWADLARIAATDQGPFSDHLQHHHWLLRNERGLKEALKQIIRHNSCSNDIALSRLLEIGLVKDTSESYTCRCDLYRLYFKDKL